MVKSATEQNLVDRLRQLGLSDHPLLVVALHQAWCSHRGQTRDDGSSYLEQHVYPVTLSVIDYFSNTGRELTATVIAAALLHDTLEDDTTLTEEIVRRRLDQQVYRLVKPLTKESSDLHPGKTKQERKRARDEKYHAALQEAPPEAKVIKILDRLNNITWIHSSPDAAKRRYYIAETQSFYLPFARGVSKDLWEMLQSALEEAKSRCGI